MGARQLLQLRLDVAKGWDFDSDTNGFLIGVDPSRPVGQDGVIHLGVFAGYCGNLSAKRRITALQ